MINITDQQEYLLLGKITGTLTAEEKQEVEQLLQHNPSLQTAYDELLKELPASWAESSFSHLNKAGYWRSTSDLIQPAGRQTPRTILVYRWVAAAAVLLLIAGGWWLYQQNTQTPAKTLISERIPEKNGIQLTLANGQAVNLSTDTGNLQVGGSSFTNAGKTLTFTAGSAQAAGMNRVAVPAGMDYKINLADGSVVWLNSATQLDFPFNFASSKREITIKGEAYVEVAKDPSRPFIIKLPGGAVEVLGTAFNVNTYDEGIVRVALVEGAVKLLSAKGDITLTPGMEGVYKEGQGVSSQHFDAKYVLGWRKGEYYFNEATLEEVSGVIPRWYGIQAVIDNPTLKERKLVGVLDRNLPLSVFQDDLKAIAGIDSYIDSKGVLHFK